MDFETRAIHEGQEPDPTTGALTTPIYATSTYVQDEVGSHKGYEYSRVSNPTRSALQACLAVARGRRARSRVRVGARRHDDAHAPPEPRRPHRADRGRLRRRVPVDVAGLRAEGIHLRVRARGGVREPRRPSRRPHTHGLGRDAVESAAEHRRHPCGRRRGACGRRDPRRGQHLRHARTCRRRWLSARTSSCTRRRSTSAGTPT